MTQQDLIEIWEYYDLSRKAAPQYEPTEADNKQILLEYLNSQVPPGQT